MNSIIQKRFLGVYIVGLVMIVSYNNTVRTKSIPQKDSLSKNEIIKLENEFLNQKLELMYKEEINEFCSKNKHLAPSLDSFQLSSLDSEIKEIDLLRNRLKIKY